jgi:putative permease
MQPVERMSYSRLAGYTALVLATLTVAYVIYQLNQVVLLFVLSIILAAALRAPMLSLQRRRIPRGGAILLLYLLILSVFGAYLIMVSQPLRAELRQAGQRFPVLYDSLVRRWQNSDQQWQQTVAAELPLTPEILASIDERGPQIAYRVVGATYDVLNIAISIVAILTLTFYWLIDEDRFIRLWLMLLPVQQRMTARHMWQDIESRVGTYVRSEAIQFVLTLSLLWAGLRALGVEYATTWALYGALAQLIPWVGIPLTLLPAIPMFLTDSPLVALGTIGLIIAVGTLMDRVIEPRLGAVGIVHPIVSVLALMILGEVAGILGMLVALPLAATLQSMLSQLVQMNAARASAQSVYATRIQDLRARMLRLQEQLPEQGDRRLALEGMFKRLDSLLENADQAVQSRATAPELRRMPPHSEAPSHIPTVAARGRGR